MSQIIVLKCTGCRAHLDVSPDMTRFACGYCGAEQLVERRGGTISLKAVTDAISKVQVGTDKTAAELAIVRFQRDLESGIDRRRVFVTAVQSEGNIVNYVLGAFAISFCVGFFVYMLLLIWLDKWRDNLIGLPFWVWVAIVATTTSTSFFAKNRQFQRKASLDQIHLNTLDSQIKAAKRNIAMQKKSAGL